MRRWLVLLAAVPLAGCYQTHHGLDVRPPEPRDAGRDARAPLLPDAFVPDAFVPDAGPPPFVCEGDSLELAAHLEARALEVGLRLPAEPGGEGVITALADGVATVALDDGGEATFTVADPSTLDGFYAQQRVEVLRDGPWDRLATSGHELIAAVHVATVFQVSVPPFEVSSGLSRGVRFELDPRCVALAPACGEAATTTSAALRADFEGDPDLYLRPGDTAERGGIDRWRVHFEGAVGVDFGDETCRVRTGLHAILELRYEFICIC